jgi:hypothetical protein
MLIIELGVTLLALVVAFVVPKVGSSVLAPFERKLARLAHRRQLAVLVVGGTSLALRAAVLPILPIPYPGLQDEFSYQLMADTFAHGRLTNPTHPMWVHFETLFVIHRPSYCSMYYPAQGMFLALGQLVGRHPFWGVWLSVGLMCSAICWMLQAWVGPFWALIGGLLSAIRIGAFSYWDNSYWGGAVTALGGALVLGALPRIKRSQRVRDALLMGAGFALLAASRPYESLFFSVPVFTALGIWMWRRGRGGQRQHWLQAAFPLALVLIATAGFLLYYFWRTTGNPVLPAYIVNLRTYAVNPNFAWLPLRPVPQYHHEIIRSHWGDWDIRPYDMIRAHPIVSVVVKILMLWFFYLGPLLSLPFLALGFALPYGTSLKDVGAKTRFLLLVCAANLIAMFLAVPDNPHYAAAITAAIYTLVLMAMQRVRRWRHNSTPTGVFLVRSVAVLAVVLLVLRIAIPLFGLSIRNPSAPWTWASPWNQLRARARVENQLKAEPGKHLVIVHYNPGHDPGEGWVNNRADIDESKIVWAQDMGPEENLELINYFKGRNIWLVQPDVNPFQVTPLPDDQEQAARTRLGIRK